MPAGTTLYRVVAAVIGVTTFLLVVDFIFFGSKNIEAIITAITTSYSQNPIGSWGLTAAISSLLALIVIVSLKRRRDFLKRLREKIDAAERITLIELARSLDETPAKVEIELRRMAVSKVRRLPGILIISRGKHVYLGEALLRRIVELYGEGLTRGEIAGRLQIPRNELDKAITHLIDEGLIEEREETKPVKVRPSYRRGTR